MALPGDEAPASPDAPEPPREGTGAPGLTKVVATIGPACDAPATLAAMLRAGVSVARLNLSHGSHAEHAARAARVREAADRCGVPVAILFDTKGPEVRTAPLCGPPVELAPGDSFVLHVDGRATTRGGTSVTHVLLPREVEAGALVLVDDGRIELRVLEADDAGVRCEVVRGGELGSQKSVHVRGARLSLPSLGEADRADLRFAVEQGADYVAASFVRSAEDVKRIRELVRGFGAEIPIIAKIEDQGGVDHLEDVVAAADGTLVARGDLGVALPVEEVPLVQKRIIRTTVAAGKPAVTATQMLDSMERNPRPTRAEATDVANAIFDGTSAVMLSGETARGRHPVEAVRTMVRLARRAESALGEYGDLQRLGRAAAGSVTEAVARAAVELAHELRAAAILTVTETGFTSRAISKHRPRCPILALTSDARVVRRLCLNWGVTPLLVPEAAGGGDAARIRFGIERAQALGRLRAGDLVVTTAGISRAVGTTSQIRVVPVK
jgi:pyruvate kinase